MSTKTFTRDLHRFSGAGYDKGRPLHVQAAWFAISHLVVQKWWCPRRLRVSILRSFGAEIGARVLIRQRVRVQWPWKLSVGDDCWIGEGVWILNLEPVRIGSNVCLSQEALLCTGSHDHRSPTMEFDNAPITIHDAAWVAARATVLRGVTVGQSATIGACSLITRDVEDGATLLAPGACRPGY